MWRILLVSVGLLMLMGCGSKRNQGGVVSGKITYKGKPVNGAVLHFYALPATKVEIPVPVDQDGTFRGSGIAPGEYKIVIEPSQVPPESAKMPPLPKDMDPAKSEELKQKYQQAYGQDVPTISFPNKYKKVASTDLKYAIKEGDQTLLLDLND